MKPYFLFSICFSSFLFGGHRSVAQTDLTNTGILQINTATDTLFISGSHTNTSAAALVNNGNLYILQNLINGQASMTVGTGSLYLNGTIPQSLSGAQPFKTFNFFSNNTTGITLNNDLSVSGAHTYSAGLIISSATPNYLIYEAGSSYTGDGDGQHVNGWVRKNGSTNFVFPVGDNIFERTIGITNLSVVSSFNAKYSVLTPNKYNVAMPLMMVDPNEYWIVNQLSGTNAQVVMNWDNTDVAFPNFLLAGIQVANYTAGNWTGEGGSATGIVATVGTITSNAINSFGSFTFGATAFLLPVEMKDFTVKRTGSSNLLSWTMLDEVNMKNYEVQRSDDGASFYLVGSVNGRNQASVQSYSMKDGKPMKEVAYYRLRLIDKDGKEKYSKVIAVYNPSSNEKLMLVTNPVHEVMTITAGIYSGGEYNYQITSLNGQDIQKGRFTIQAGATNQIPLLSSIGRGVYILDIRNTTYRLQKMILVQ